MANCFFTFLRPIIPSGSGTFRIVFWVETIRASIPGARGGAGGANTTQRQVSLQYVDERGN